ncbi:TAXI family TRAP transporter solute-binding subunit [Natrialbaceae archaeon GCM10025810]|uniref:TAXI family TRAP transporter solute-binding subunit n=1 Tax=Halovalidus salilacus TaxID=3075124 RepID=UPI00360F64F0
MVDRPSLSSGVQTRRSFLAAAGIGSVASFAGCLSSGGSDNSTVRMQTSTSGTTAYTANQGLASAINDESDDLDVEVASSDGTEQNIGDLNGEDAEMVYIQNWSAHDIREGNEPYDGLDFDLTQVFHFYDLPWYFITNNEDLETLSDIESGMTVSPTPEGSGTAAGLERALEYAVDEYERGNADYSEQGSQMNENQLDVGVGTLMNFTAVPSWMEDNMSSVDLRVLDVDDSTAEEWEDDDRVLAQPVDTSALEDAETPGEIPAPTFSYNFVARADLDYDTVYDFLEVMHEYRSDLEEYNALLGFFEEEEFFVKNPYEGIPFHEAAADFYDEIGIWSDDFESAGN